MTAFRLCCAVSALLAGVAALLYLCLKGPAPAVGPADPGWFEDVNAEVGLDFVHDAGPDRRPYFMPQIIGSGAALFDFDGDGRLDIYLLQNGGPERAAQPALPPDARRHVRGRQRRLRPGLRRLQHGRGRRRRQQRRPARRARHPSTAASGCSSTTATASSRDVTEEAGLDNPALGHLGRLRRLRPRRLARPRRRQLRRLRPVLALHRRRTGRRTTAAPSTFTGTRHPAVPQPRAGAGRRGACASRT